MLSTLWRQNSNGLGLPSALERAAVCPTVLQATALQFEILTPKINNISEGYAHACNLSTPKCSSQSAPERRLVVNKNKLQASRERKGVRESEREHGMSEHWSMLLTAEARINFPAARGKDFSFGVDVKLG